MSGYAQLAALTDAFLQHPAFAHLPSPLSSTPPKLAALVLPPSTDDSFKSKLASLGCSNPTIDALDEILQQTCRQLEEKTQNTFVATMGQAFSGEEGDWFIRCTSAVSKAMTRKLEFESRSVRDWIIREVTEAKARHSSSSPSVPLPYASTIYPLPSPPPEPTGSFTEEVVSILQKAFDMSESLTRAEVKELIKVTGLNNKQVGLFLPLDQSVELI